MQIIVLLSEGKFSQRRIAKIVGVSRGTVHAVASGRRPPPTTTTEDAGMPRPGGSPRRCPQCGAFTKMPCLACYIRNLARPQPDENTA